VQISIKIQNPISLFYSSNILCITKYILKHGIFHVNIYFIFIEKIKVK